MVVSCKTKPIFIKSPSDLRNSSEPRRGIGRWSAPQVIAQGDFQAELGAARPMMTRCWRSWGSSRVQQLTAIV